MLQAGTSVELILNLVWAVLAMAGLYAWMRHRARTRTGHRAQLVAFSMLLLILFPVVSISDDLWAAHNPAEADTCMRRDHLTAQAHTIIPGLPALTVDLLTDLPPAFAGYAPVVETVLPRAKALPAAPTFKRPPPAA